MPYKHNILKQERIDRYGVTVDLPLFNQEKTIPVKLQNLPDWVFDGRDFSKEAYTRFQKHFGDQMIQYLQTIIRLGGEATDNQIKEITGWPASTVSARRNALKNLNLVIPVYVKADSEENYVQKSITGPFGTANSVWTINFKKLYTLLFD